MPRLITQVLIAVALLCVPTWDCSFAKPLTMEKFYESNARYRRHHRRKASHRQLSDSARRSTTIYVPPRDVSGSAGVWTTENAPVPYSYISATMVLDAKSGRRPVIGALDCANPSVDWYQRKRFSSWVDFQVGQ